MWGELALSFQAGNVYVIGVFIIALIASVVLIERFIMLQFVYNLKFTMFNNNLKKMLASKDFDRALSFCRSVSNTSLPKIAIKAIEAAENDPTTIKAAIEEESLDFLPRIESRINILPALATLALLISILGSLDQLWSAFHSIDILDSAKKQASLSHGVAESLHPTGMGLLSAMMILVFHQMLKGLALRILEKTHLGITVLYNLLVPSDMVFAGPMPSPQAAAPAEAAPAAADESDEGEEEEESEEEVEDPAIEDIKDEEEII